MQISWYLEPKVERQEIIPVFPIEHDGFGPEGCSNDLRVEIDTLDSGHRCLELYQVGIFHSSSKRNRAGSTLEQGLYRTASPEEITGWSYAYCIPVVVSL